MDTRNNSESLRGAVEKWFLPSSMRRITRVVYTNDRRSRCVCVQTFSEQGAQSIFFFRHSDGSWNVFPPSTLQSSMRMYQS